ncbi:MAG: hypothetical protein GX557_14275 [Chloroflexi bacterium]|nr:hypothetical protein [Chloroflexota bacterium]
MKKLGASIVAFLSVPLFVIGLLFLIAGAEPGKSSRLLVGAALVAAGLFMLLLGLRRLRRLALIAPAALKTNAVALARRLGGELTVAQLRAEYRISEEQARDALDELARDNTCRREQRGDREVYVFTGLLPSLVEKVCPYCNTKLPVRSELRKCPNCGAQLDLKKS